MCIDCGALNEDTVIHAYPILCTNNILEFLGSSCCSRVLGYHPLPGCIEEELGEM